MKYKILFFIILYFIANEVCFAQEQDTSKAWSLENLEELEQQGYFNELDSSANSGDIQNGIVLNYNYGWFITPPKITRFSIFVQTGDVIDYASNLRSKSFVPTNNAFTSSLIKSSQRDIYKKNNKEDTESDYPETGSFAIGLDFQFKLPLLPFFSRTMAGISWDDGLINSIDKSKQFLTSSGSLKTIKEVNFIWLEETNLLISSGIQIPFWSGYYTMGKNQATSVFSSYYLYLGFAGRYALKSDATQFVQIADPKDEIRYANGRDTLNLFKEKELKSLQHFKTYIDLKLGSDINLFFMLGRFELTTQIPVNSVLKDAQWKQWHWSIDFSFSIDEIIKKMIK